MARKVRHSSLETRTARLKLAVRRKPYPGPSLGRGIKLNYRRNRTNGTWEIKVSDGHGKYWTKGFAQADDHDEANGKTILDVLRGAGHREATGARRRRSRYDRPDHGRSRARRLPARSDLARCELANADWPRRHLTAVLLSKPVQLLTPRELKAWRDGLLGTITAASVNRLCKGLRAALELAAQHDPRIKNRDAWEVGLAGLPDAQTGAQRGADRRQGSRLRRRSLSNDPALGLLIDTLATTGARPSQVTRLTVEDLHDMSRSRSS